MINKVPVFGQMYGKSNQDKTGLKSTNLASELVSMPVFIRFFESEGRPKTGTLLVNFRPVFR